MTNNKSSKKHSGLKLIALALVVTLAQLVLSFAIVSCNPPKEPAPADPYDASFHAHSFSPTDQTITLYAGDSIRFISTTTYDALIRYWYLPGGSPDSLEIYKNFRTPELTPYIKYLYPGTYDVTLRIIPNHGTTSDARNTRVGYIKVLPDTNTSNNCGTVVNDFDGNVYPIIKIGNQCWMQQNLKTKHYNDGEVIPTGLNDLTWSKDDKGAYAYYNNDPNNFATNGLLYNGFAVATNNLCPQGWHIPTKVDFEELMAFIGGEAKGGDLKTNDTNSWDPPNTGATNSSGFKALASGFRVNSGYFSGLGINAKFWSSTLHTDGGAFHMYLSNDQENVYLESYPQENGFSCRCLKD